MTALQNQDPWTIMVLIFYAIILSAVFATVCIIKFIEIKQLRIEKKNRNMPRPELPLTEYGSIYSRNAAPEPFNFEGLL